MNIPMQLTTPLTMVGEYNNGKPEATSDYFVVAGIKHTYTGTLYCALWHTRGKPVDDTTPMGKWLPLALYFPDEQSALAYAVQYKLWLGSSRDDIPPRTDALSYAAVGTVKEVA